MSIFTQLILASLSVSLVSLVGLGLVVRQRIAKNSLFLLISFAAGTLIASALLNSIPESLEFAHASTTMMAVLAGVVGFFSLERLLIWHHCHTHSEQDHPKPTALLIMISDTIHNFFDGLALAAAFLASPVVGLTTTVAIIAHEVPQELADISVLLHKGMAPKRALWLNGLSSLAALLGAVVGYVSLHAFEPLQPIFLGLTAGMFLYIALSDLIPEIHEQHEHVSATKQIVSLFLGVAVIVGITQALPHQHSHQEHDHHHEHDQHQESEATSLQDMAE